MRRASGGWRIIAFVFAVVVSTALVAGAGFLLARTTPRTNVAAELMGFAATAGFVMGPLVVGPLLAFWDPGRSAASRRVFRRFWVTVAVLEILSVALIIAYTALADAPVWLPVVFIGGGAVALGAAIAGGKSLRGIEPAGVVPASSSLYPPEERRRDVRRMVGATLIALAVGGAGSVVILLLLDMQDSWFPLAAFTIAFAGLVEASTGSLVTLRLGKRARGLVDGDIGRLRAIGRTVTRGKGPSLTEEDEIAAARYAPLAVTIMVYQVITLSCLYLALGLQQIATLVPVDEFAPLDLLRVGLLVFLVVVLAVTVPLQLRYIRRAREYASAHSVAPPEGASPAVPS